MRGFIPFAATMYGIPGGQYDGQACSILINADGSIYVSNWDLLQTYYTESVAYDSPEFVVLTLLLAARGHIKESTSEEAKLVAIATLADRTLRGLDDDDAKPTYTN